MGFNSGFKGLTQAAMGKHIFEHSPPPNFMQVCHLVIELLIAYEQAALLSDANAPNKGNKMQTGTWGTLDGKWSFHLTFTS